MPYAFLVHSQCNTRIVRNWFVAPTRICKEKIVAINYEKIGRIVGEVAKMSSKEVVQLQQSIAARLDIPLKAFTPPATPKTFSLVLIGAPFSEQSYLRVKVAREIVTITGLTLRKAVGLMNSAPVVIKEFATRKEAMAAHQAFEGLSDFIEITDNPQEVFANSVQPKKVA